MVAFRKRRPALLLLAVASLFLGGVAAAAAFTSNADTDTDVSETEPVPSVANTRNAVLFLRVGLGADTLAAAGVQSAEVSDLASAVFTAVSNSSTTLRTLDGDVANARMSVDALRRKVRSGLASAQEVTDLTQAKADLAAAESSRDAYIASLRSAALDTLNSSVASTLGTMWNNRTWLGMPPEFLVDTMTQREWVTLRDDLAAERISAKEGVPCPTEAATHLAECRALSPIATANVNLSTYLAGVQAAWNTAVQ